MTAFTKRLIEAYNGNNLEAFNDLLTPGVVLVRDDEKAHGLDEFKGVLRRLRRAFPDIQYRIDDVIESDGRIVLRWEASGTHREDYLGVPPSGQRVTYTGTTIYELRAGQVARVFVAADLFSLFRRLRAASTEVAPEAHV